MSAQPSAAVRFRTFAVANGAALQVELQQSSVTYEVSDALKARLKESVAASLDEGFRAFVLDIGGVTALDSSGVGVFIALHHQVAGAGGTLAIVRACPLVQKVLRLMRLDKFLALYPDAEKALHAVVDVR